jgi:methylase of polypeptide subunit release factors
MPSPEQSLPLATRLLGEREQGPLRNLVGTLAGMAHRIGGAHRERERLEHVAGTPLVVLPSVFNPRLLRTGAFFATTIAAHRLGADGNVLDLGTGSGVCAVFAARHARSVVAVDLNLQAVRCVDINARLNRVEQRVECRHGDLFAPVADRTFDAIFFNPPFIVGAPSDERDFAWRSTDVASRFAAGLATHLAPGGRAYLLLSTYGDACAQFVDELARRNFVLSVFATRRFVNERVTVIEVRGTGGA